MKKASAVKDKNKAGLTGKFTDLVIRIEQNKIITAIKNGLVMLIPVFLIGSVALILLNIPIPAFTEFIKGTEAKAAFLNGFVRDLLLFLHNATFEILALLLLLTVSYSYAKELRPEKTHIHVISAVTAAAAFIASYDIATLTAKRYLGPRGTVYALIVAIAATRLFILLSEKMQSRKSRYYTSGADSNFTFSMSSFFPILITVAAFASVNLLIGLIPGIDNFSELIIYVFNAPFRYLGASYGSNMLYLFFLSVLWFFGVHGGNALNSVAEEVFGSTGMFSKSTLDVFVSMGGGGAVLCLVLAIIIFSRSRPNRRLAYSAAPSVFFNISEVVGFGLPVVFNAAMLIPFILTPLVFMTTTFLAMTIGIVPETVTAVNWTTPIFISGYIATDSIWGSILQLVNLCIGIGIYYPFIRLSEKIQSQKKERIIKEMTALFVADEKKGVSTPFMNRRDHIGAMAKLIASDLRRAVAENAIEMHYQPQMDGSGRLIGAEALLRWRYGETNLYPPLLIKIAADDNFYNELSAYVLNRVCADTKQILEAVSNKNLLISVNINSGELRRAFIENILKTLNDMGIPHKNFGLEITETDILVDTTESMAIIDFLAQKEIVLSIDDFSMGSTSLKYLQNNKFNYVKLDGALVKSMKANPRSAEIITSIVTLGRTLGFEVVAEYVENEEVLNKLIGLGCSVFQGWYYSPAIPLGEFIEYTRDPKRN